MLTSSAAYDRRAGGLVRMPLSTTPSQRWDPASVMAATHDLRIRAILAVLAKQVFQFRMLLTSVTDLEVNAKVHRLVQSLDGVHSKLLLFDVMHVH